MKSVYRTWIREVETRFQSIGKKERAEKEKEYLKGDLKFFGVPVPEIRKVAKAFRRSNPKLDHDELLGLTSMLWKRGYHECRTLAVALLEQYRELLRAKDVAWLEEWLQEAKTWAHVDWIAVHLIGPMSEEFASVDKRVHRWVTHDDFWIRRSALLAFLIRLREGRDGFDRFARYAETMLHEKEFFIRKAIGWVLRETSKKQPELVIAFLTRNIRAVSPLTFREGSRQLSATDQKRLARLRAGR